MAGNAPATAELVRTTRAELRPLPDVHFSLVTAGAGFFASDPRVAGPREQAGPDRLPPGAVTPETDPAQLVGFAKELGARGIKIYSDLDAARVRALTDEAHREGLRAWAHATVFPTRPDEVVGAGVDGISHVCGLPWEVLPDVPERFSERPRFDPAQVDPSDARFTALFQEMWRRGTVLDATLFLYTNEATWQRGCIPDLMIPLARAAHREGVPISTGTDFFNDPTEPYPSLHSEIEYLVQSGVLTPGQAITAATLNGARALGIAETHGTLERGKVADLVILRADPTTDIGALRTVVGVVKGGRLLRRDDYEARVRSGGS
jgi:imidazolonepropionase-like amidohydrolase